jgi:phage gp29-like protein
MIKFLFTRRKRRSARELAPQLTAPQRMALEFAGVPPAGLPYSAYDQMEQDGMVQTALTVKKLGVLAAPHRIVSADGSEEARKRAAFVEEVFARMDGSPLTILHGAMDAFAKGWSVLELVWRAEDGRFGLAAVRPKDPALFGLDVDAFGNVRSLNLQLPGEAPVPVPRGKFVVYRNRDCYGRAKGRSDLDAAYKHFQSKQTLLAAWRVHLERYASPTLMGKFQRGSSAEEQTAVLSALQNLHRHTAFVVPDDVQVEALGGQREGSLGFLEAIEFHNREMARAILGQTLTTDEGKRVGSLAMGKVHLQVLMLQLAAIRRELADTVMTEQVIRPLCELNFGPAAVPRFEFEEPEMGVFARGEM